MRRHEKGISRARRMRKWSNRKGGFDATADGFDRTDAGTLASLIDQWYRRLEERNYSPRSIEAHKWALRTFLQWSEERDLRRPEQVTKPILESYQRWLYRYRKKDDKPLGITTQRARLGVIQRFFAWLCKENRLPANPASDLELPRQVYRLLPKALNHEQIRTLFSIPDITDPLGIRDRTILELFYATGIRRTELVRLDVGDLDGELGILRVRGKGNRERVVPVGTQALDWLGKYMEKTRPLLLVSSGEHALFLSGYGERFSPGYIGNWVRKTIDKMDIGRSGSCHLLRHSCATHMLENGADIRYIQQMLGHAHLNTTQVYTEVGIQQLREVYMRTHPSAIEKSRS